MTAIVVRGVSAAGATSGSREISSRLGAGGADADHLRRVHRDRLRAVRPDTLFLLLHAERSVSASQAASRKDPFMPPSLLDSRLSVLEPLERDERGVVVDVEPPLSIVVPEATEWMSQNA